jgi:hypothetical protein
MIRQYSVCGNSLRRDDLNNGSIGSEMIHVTCGIGRISVRIPHGQSVADTVRSLAGVCNAPINRLACYVNGTPTSDAYRLTDGDRLDLRATWGAKAADQTDRELLEAILKRQRLLQKRFEIIEAKLDRVCRPKKRTLPELNPKQQLLLTALGDDILRGERLATKAGWHLTSWAKHCLSMLVKLDVLGKSGSGYFIKDWAKRLLDRPAN